MRLTIAALEARRARGLSVAAAALGFVVAFALPGLAEIVEIEPSSGRVHRGESTSAVVTVIGDSPTCLSATASHPTITAILDVVTTCGIGDRTVAMNVQTSDLTPTGEHTVTIREIDTLDAVVDERAWKLRVLASATTTSTSSTTTTTTSSTTTTTTSSTTTTTSSSTTTTAATTTTTSAPTTASSTTTATTSAGATTSSSLPDSTTVTTAGGAPPAESTTTGPPIAATGGGPGGPSADSGQASAGDADGVVSSLTRSLRSGLASLLPPAVADIVVSPLLVADVIARAVLASGSALLPTAVMGALVGWATWSLMSRRGRFEEGEPAEGGFLSAVAPAGLRLHADGSRNDGSGRWSGEGDA